MALIRTNKGGSSSPVTLWTNASPSTDFAAQNVSLSSSISNFEYVGIKYKITPADTNTYDVLYPVSQVADFNTSNTCPVGIMGVKSGYVEPYIRAFGLNSNDPTSIAFQPAVYILSPTKAANNTIIPVEIYGLR